MQGEHISCFFNTEGTPKLRRELFKAGRMSVRVIIFTLKCKGQECITWVRELLHRPQSMTWVSHVSHDYRLHEMIM